MAGGAHEDELDVREPAAEPVDGQNRGPRVEPAPEAPVPKDDAPAGDAIPILLNVGDSSSQPRVTISIQ